MFSLDCFMASSSSWIPTQKLTSWKKIEPHLLFDSLVPVCVPHLHCISPLPLFWPYCIAGNSLHLQPWCSLQSLPERGSHTREGLFNALESDMKVTQSCPTLCDPHGLYSPWNSPGQSTGVGRVAFPFSRRSSHPRAGEETNGCSSLGRWLQRATRAHCWPLVAPGQKCNRHGPAVVPKSFPALQPHEPPHTRLPCPSFSPGVCSDSCLFSWWCQPTISSSVAPYCP